MCACMCAHACGKVIPILHYLDGYLKITSFPRFTGRAGGGGGGCGGWEGMQRGSHIWVRFDKYHIWKCQIPVILVSHFFLISSSNIPITLLQIQSNTSEATASLIQALGETGGMPRLLLFSARCFFFCSQLSSSLIKERNSNEFPWVLRFFPPSSNTLNEQKRTYGRKDSQMKITKKNSSTHKNSQKKNTEYLWE